MTTTLTRDLVTLSRDLGMPGRGWAILGEGNTSGYVNDEYFQVKRSGAQLGALTESDLVDVLFEPLLRAVDSGEAYDETALRGLLKRSKLHAGSTKMPSADTLLHAILLHRRGVKFVGHTYVSSIAALTGTERGWRALVQGARLFPDEVIVCGPAGCCVEYADPGLPLARAVKAQVERFTDRYDTHPKAIYLQNHGFIALGANTREALAVTQMADKAAQILLGSLSVGEPKFMSAAAVEHIHKRPEARVRQRELGLIPDV